MSSLIYVILLVIAKTKSLPPADYLTPCHISNDITKFNESTFAKLCISFINNHERPDNWLFSAIILPSENTASLDSRNLPACMNLPMAEVSIFPSFFYWLVLSNILACLEMQRPHLSQQWLHWHNIENDSSCQVMLLEFRIS